MPRIVITPEKLVVAQSLERENWTHARIAEHLGVKRTAVTHALRYRKSHLGTPVQEVVGSASAQVLSRVRRAVNLAMASELRRMAAELEAEA